MAADYAALKAGGFMRQKQKDMFSMRLRVVGGTVTVQQLKAIAEAAEKFGHNYVHLTSRQGVEIPFIRLEEIDEVKDFIETNQRNPSKHRVEEHLMLNWVKQQRKLLNAGKLKPERIGKFNELLALIEENKRINQYQ